jgi:pilus assembly protein FimV
MSRGQKPLVLMMALSLPGAAHALGLGDIHVNSALNEPLAADIEILGATAEELSSLTASVANKDTFLRFGAERPAFLTTATFKVSQDAKGRPVLVVRSTESFTDPVVNLLVDLRWYNGEVIRQYSLLLDPAGLHSPAVQLEVPIAAAPSRTEIHAAAAAAPAVIPAASTDTGRAAAGTTRTTTHVKIGAKATLRGVAWRVGARSDSDLKKTMLAIFRANPHAFEGNINRLRLAAVLTIPSAADIATISKEDANREIDAQMTSWRASPQKVRTAAAPVQTVAAHAVPAQTVPMQAVPVSAQENTPTAPSAAPVAAAEAAAVTLRVQTLERGLHDIQGQLEREHEKLLGLQAQVRHVENTVDSPVEAQAAPRHWLLTSLIAGIALLAGAFGIIFLRLRRLAETKISAKPALAVSEADETAKSAKKPVVAKEPAPRDTPREMPRPVWQDLNDSSAARRSMRDEPEEQARAAATAPPEPVFTVNEEELRAAYEDTLDLSAETAILAADIAEASAETQNLPAATVNLNAQTLQTAAAGVAEESETVQIGAETLHVDATKLDYNLLDLDQTAQHVHMPSVLHERAIVKERRTNLVDVLKMAVEREPDRRDLRMKLLETYYAAAAVNRRGFLELVQKVARDRGRLGEGEWEKIAFMGKEIASDNALFSAASEEDDELADCA